MYYKCTNCGKKVNDAHITDYGDFCSKICLREFDLNHIKPNLKENELKIRKK